MLQTNKFLFVAHKLKIKFPDIKGPRKDDICYATQNRQDAVRSLSRDSDMVIVVGSTNSSNSNRLKELSEQLGVPGYLVDQPEQILALVRSFVDHAQPKQSANDVP